MYAPGQINGDVSQFLGDELHRIARAMDEPKDMIMLEMRYVAPAKPKDGMVVLADGTSWNPSAGGQGFYGYYGGSWKKLG